MKFPPFRKPSEVNSPIPRARGACRPAASPRPERSTQYLRQTTPANLAYRGGRVPQENSSQPRHSFRCSSKSLLFPYIKRVRSNQTSRNHPSRAKSQVDDRLLLFREATAPGSDLRHASIDGEIHTGDVRTFIGSKEHDCCRDFLGHASATHWDLRGELCGRLLGLFSGKARRRR